MGAVWVGGVVWDAAICGICWLFCHCLLAWCLCAGTFCPVAALPAHLLCPASCPPAWPPACRRFAVKSMPKRFASGGHLEPYYVRRVLNEVDICNHLGRQAAAWQAAGSRAGSTAAPSVPPPFLSVPAGLFPLKPAMNHPQHSNHSYSFSASGPSTCATCMRRLRTPSVWTW